MDRDQLRRAALAAVVLCCTSLDAAAWQPPRSPASPKAETCPEMGEGYVKVPGSSTCVRMSGLVRVEALHEGGNQASYPVGR